MSGTTYGDHQEAAAAALNRLITREAMPLTAVDVDDSLACRDIVVGALRQRLYTLRVEGRHPMTLPPARVGAARLPDVAQNLTMGGPASSPSSRHCRPATGSHGRAEPPRRWRGCASVAGGSRGVADRQSCPRRSPGAAVATRPRRWLVPRPRRRGHARGGADPRQPARRGRPAEQPPSCRQHARSRPAAPARLPVRPRGHLVRHQRRPGPRLPRDPTQAAGLQPGLHRARGWRPRRRTTTARALPATPARQ